MTILGATSPPQFAIGESDYRDLLRKGMTYVDKTRGAADILGQGAKVHIVHRPRRFGNLRARTSSTSPIVSADSTISPRTHS